ncbi:SMP-30/gluconolactonase/LRE family protein [Streptomyces sp. NPDC088387]|uniref:SMP-30/gluconolactonase/LRE family protein n=1 Tax=Streptomyces sp. NPDC088387 TaxID=3365859 RepID=UPI003820B33C
MTTAAQIVAPDRLELGEGIRWTGEGVVLVDILTGRLFAAPDDSGGPLRQLARLTEPLGAVTPVAGRAGTWIAAAGTGICLISGRDESAMRSGNAAAEPPARPEETAVRWLARPEDRAALTMRMNDAVADPSGRFWAGSMAMDADEGAGSLYRVDHDGTVVRVLDGITVPNGPAFTADGTVMYLADSARGVIRRYALDPVTGGMGAPEPFVTVADGSPDGMVTDVEGALWVAVWGTGTVRRFLPDGTPDRVVRLPATQPAGVCLRSDVLHITSARIGLTAPGPDDGAVFTTRVDVPGTPTPPYRPGGLAEAAS